MTACASSLKINEKETVQRIENYMKDRIEKDSARGIILGLCGGIDSVLLATLAVRSIGKENVCAYFLHDRDTAESSHLMAKESAKWLGLDLKIIDIAPEMARQKVYSPGIMKISALSQTVNRKFINNSYHRLFGETPFMSTLKIGNNEFNAGWLQRTTYNLTVKHIENGFNARHRYRCLYLTELSKEKNLVLMGAANRSECEMGWFVKGGIDDLPVSPLMGLYKAQVRQLSEYLKIPEPIRNQTPSPDMIKGITDEIAMGVLYSTIDCILDALEKNMPDKEILAMGIDKKELALVKEINRLSAWKRESAHETPPVDGGVHGGLRI